MDVTAATTLFAWVDREIWLVTAKANDCLGGMIATAIDQVSIVPECPRITVAISKQHRTWELIEASNSFTLHLLGSDNIDLVWKFGLESGHHVKKFEGFVGHYSPSGNPLVETTIGWIDCRVETRLEIGDRTIYIAEVIEGQVLNFAPPLTMRRMMELAPSSRLTQLQRQRHHQSYADAEAIRQWREKHGISSHE